MAPCGPRRLSVPRSRFPARAALPRPEPNAVSLAADRGGELVQAAEDALHACRLVLLRLPLELSPTDPLLDKLTHEGRQVETSSVSSVPPTVQLIRGQAHGKPMRTRSRVPRFLQAAQDERAPCRECFLWGLGRLGRLSSSRSGYLGGYYEGSAVGRSGGTPPLSRASFWSFA
jgi:hypothetical protein